MRMIGVKEWAGCVGDTVGMANSVPPQPRFDKVAVAARMRALSATPPAPAAGTPPEHALANWLLDVAPLGADVLHTNLTVLPLTAAEWVWVEPPTRTSTTTDGQGRRVHLSELTDEAYRRQRLPSSAPRAAQQAREARIDHAWTVAHALCLALHRLGVGPKDAGRGSLALAETALWLAGPATRQPGVPIHSDLPLSAETRLGSRFGTLLTGPRFGRNGANVLRIECAAEHDIAVTPFAQLSRAQGWKDHVDHEGRPAGASSAKRAVREGRMLLHQLGAWPWAHAGKGRLSEHGDWWRNDQFVDPLRTWIAQSWCRLIFNEIARHREAVAGEPTDAAGAGASAQSWGLLQELAAQIVVALDAERLLETLRRQAPESDA